MFEGLFQIIQHQAEVNVTNRIRRRRQQVFAAGKQFDALAVGKFQKHQLGPIPLGFGVINLFCPEGLLVPAQAALRGGDFESDVTESKARDRHKMAPL